MEIKSWVISANHIWIKIPNTTKSLSKRSLIQRIIWRRRSLNQRFWVLWCRPIRLMWDRCKHSFERSWTPDNLQLWQRSTLLHRRFYKRKWYRRQADRVLVACTPWSLCHTRHVMPGRCRSRCRGDYSTRSSTDIFLDLHWCRRCHNRCILDDALDLRLEVCRLGR